ncbi:MAG: hypothetical protein EOP88_10650 [Verrucomicrobiaceae bacterium]|nr:MAG: hypothetical protein EOP88_10650 [Verrucomicrobiaceae bacterium]
MIATPDGLGSREDPKRRADARKIAIGIMGGMQSLDQQMKYLVVEEFAKIVERLEKGEPL